MKSVEIKKKKNNSKNLLEHIFNEIRLLRNEVNLFMPTEDLGVYAHPGKIRSSFNRALRKYPRSI